jgi:hypothetical protein
MRWVRWRGRTAVGRGRVHIDGGDYGDSYDNDIPVKLSKRIRSGCSDEAGTGPWAYNHATLTIKSYKHPVVFPWLAGC